MPGGKRYFNINGQDVTIPSNNADLFLKENPTAIEVGLFNIGGKDPGVIPLSNLGTFIAENPDAKPFDPEDASYYLNHLAKSAQSQLNQVNELASVPSKVNKIQPEEPKRRTGWGETAPELDQAIDYASDLGQSTYHSVAQIFPSLAKAGSELAKGYVEGVSEELKLGNSLAPVANYFEGWGDYFSDQLEYDRSQLPDNPSANFVGGLIPSAIQMAAVVAFPEAAVPYMAGMGLQTTGSAMFEYEQEMKSQGKPVDNDVMLGVGLLRGAIETATEGLGTASRYTKDAMKLMTKRKIVQNAIQNPEQAAEVFQKFMLKNPSEGRILLETLKRGALQANEEGIEEVISTIGQAAVDKFFFDEKAFDNITQEALQSYLGGITLGGIFSGVSSRIYKNAVRDAINSQGEATFALGKDGSVFQVLNQDDKKVYGINEFGSPVEKNIADIEYGTSISKEEYDQFKEASKASGSATEQNLPDPTPEELQEKVKIETEKISHESNTIYQAKDLEGNVFFIKSGDIDNTKAENPLTIFDPRTGETRVAKPGEINEITQITPEEYFQTRITEEQQNQQAAQQQEVVAAQQQQAVQQQSKKVKYNGQVGTVQDVGRYGEVKNQFFPDNGGDTIDIPDGATLEPVQMTEQAQQQPQVNEAELPEGVKVLKVQSGNKPYSYTATPTPNGNYRIVDPNKPFSSLKAANSAIRLLEAKYPNLQFEAIDETDTSDDFAEGSFAIKGSKKVKEEPKAEVPKSDPSTWQMPSEKRIADAEEAFLNKELARQAELQKAAKIAAQADQLPTTVAPEPKPKKRNLFIPKEAIQRSATDPNTAEEAVLQFFVKGGQISRDDFKALTGWGADPKDPHGQTELKESRWLHSETGTPVDSLIDSIWSPMLEAYIEREGANAIQSVVQEIISSYPTRQSMIERLRQIQDEYTQELSPEEVQEELRKFALQEEAEFSYLYESLDELATDQEITELFLLTPEEYETYKGAIGSTNPSDNESNRTIEAGSDQAVTGEGGREEVTPEVNEPKIKSWIDEWNKIKTENIPANLDMFYNKVKVALNGIAQKYGEDVVKEFQNLKYDIEQYAKDYKTTSQSTPDQVQSTPNIGVNVPDGVQEYFNYNFEGFSDEKIKWINNAIKNIVAKYPIFKSLNINIGNSDWILDKVASIRFSDKWNLTPNDTLETVRENLRSKFAVDDAIARSEISSAEPGNWNSDNKMYNLPIHPERFTNERGILGVLAHEFGHVWDSITPTKDVPELLRFLNNTPKDIIENELGYYATTSRNEAIAEGFKYWVLNKPITPFLSELFIKMNLPVEQPQINNQPNETQTETQAQQTTLLNDQQPQGLTDAQKKERIDDIEKRRQEEIDKETPIKTEDVIIDGGDSFDFTLTFRVTTFKNGSTTIRHTKSGETIADNRSKKLDTYPTLSDFNNFFAEDLVNSKGIIKTELVKDNYTDGQSQEIKAAKEKNINAKYDAELAALNPTNEETPQPESPSGETQAIGTEQTTENNQDGVTEEEVGFNYSSLFNNKTDQQPTNVTSEREQKYQESSFDKNWAPTLDVAIQKLKTQYAGAKATYDDWVSRKYKTNKGVVEVGVKAGDDFEIGTTSIGAANERRRQSVLNNATDEMNRVVKDLTSLGFTKAEINGIITPNPETPAEFAGDVLEIVPTYKVPEVFTNQSFNDFSRKLSAGEIKLPEFQQAFQVLLASKDGIIAELNSMTKVKLLEGMSSMGQYRYKNEKKDDIVRALWDDKKTTFAFGTFSYSHGEKIEDVIARKVAKTTQEDIDKYAEEHRQYIEDYRKRVQAFKKSITNPETLDEFNTFIKNKGLSELSPEQKAAYDLLVTDKVIDKRNQEAEKKAEISGVELGSVNMDITETKHTKTGEPLFVVRLSERVERDVYNDLNTKAKQLGGYYSSFRGNGAVPGFQFKSKEQAEKFISLRDGNVSNADIKEEQQAESVQNRAVKLRENAEKMIEAADIELSKERLTNTYKRATEAGRAEDKANESKRMAQTMLNIADAIDNGDVKLLSGVKAKTHIELLDSLVMQAKYRQASEMSNKDSNIRYEEIKNQPATLETIEYLRSGYYPAIYEARIRELINKSLSTSGVKLIANRWQKRIAGLKDGESYQLKSDQDVQDITDMFNALPQREKDYNRIADELAEHKRMKAMGIENDSMLRAALREYIQYRGKKSEGDKVKQLERALVGRKGVGIDFFPTPKNVAQRMAEEANIEEGMSVLEPSAGTGNIADAIKEQGVTPDVAEISSELSEVLKAKGYNLVATDFMGLTGKTYDRIVMNPPFSNGMDGEHVQKAFELLNPGGKIVAIVGQGSLYRSDKKAVAFREWLDSVGAEIEALPQGTFNDKTLLNTTGANASLVIIDKNSLTINEPTTPYQKHEFVGELLNEPVEAYHGSPHSFDQFSLEKIGTGEGLQAFGYGLYFTNKKEIAEEYAKRLSKPPQNQYGVSIYYASTVTIDGKKLGKNQINIIDTYFDKGSAYFNGKPKSLSQLKEVATDFIDGSGDSIELMAKRIMEARSYKYEQKPIPSKNLYTVTIHDGKEPSEYDYLRWDKPLTENQFNKIKSQIEKEGIDLTKYSRSIASREFGQAEKFKDGEGNDEVFTSEGIYQSLAKALTGNLYSTGNKEVSEFLLRAGIDGIEYPAIGGTGGREGDAMNYVVFDDKAITIKEHSIFEPPTEYIQQEIDFSHGSEEKRQEAIQQAYNGIPEQWNDTGERNANSLPKTLRTVPKEFKEAGYVDIIGREVTGPQDIADLNAIHRSPYIEKAHVTILKEGKIVATTASTLNRSNQTKLPTPMEVVALAKKYGGDEIYLMHNHPSGNPQPSKMDAWVTLQHQKYYEQNGIKFGGHVVIDHEKFSLIPAVESKELSFESQDQLQDLTESVWANQVKQYDYTSNNKPLFTFREQLTGENAFYRVGEIASALMNEYESTGAVIWITPRMTISAWDTFPKGVTEEQLIQGIEFGLSQNIGSSYIIAYDGNMKLKGRYPEGVLDVVNLDKGVSEDVRMQKSKADPDIQKLWDSEFVGDIFKNEDNNPAKSNVTLQEPTPIKNAKEIKTSKGETIRYSNSSGKSTYAGLFDVQREADREQTNLDVFIAVERQINEQKHLTLSGATKISGPDDIAFLFRHLESAVSENVFAVFIDKDSKFKVLYLSTGSTTASIIDTKLIVSAAKEFNAESVTVVHNHPTGNLKPSDSDLNTHRNITLALDGICRVNDAIIIDLDKGLYSIFNSEEKDVRTNKDVKNPVDVKVYAFDKQILYVPSNNLTQITNSSDVAKYLSGIKRGTGNKYTVLVLNIKNNITRAFVTYDISSKNIMPIIGKSGENVIISGNQPIAQRQLGTLKNTLKAAGINILDYVQVEQDQSIIESYKSYADEGYLMEPKSGYTAPQTISINGVERPRTNSNGQPIAQTEQGIRNFYEWFGDSKVVDEQGRPLVVYHGTDADFNVFITPAFLGSKEVAQSYAEDRSGTSGFNPAVIGVYVRFQNAATESNVLAVGKELGYEADNDMAFSLLDPNINGKYKSDKVISALQKKGFDSAIIDDFSKDSDIDIVDSYVAFSPTQIKSATGNDGTFSPTDPNILKEPDFAGDILNEPAMSYKKRGISVSTKQKPISAKLNVSTASDRFIRGMFDKELDIKKVLEKIIELGGSVPDEYNLYKKATNLPSINEQEIAKYHDFYLRGLIDSVKDIDKPIEEINRYIKAKSAIQRHEVEGISAYSRVADGVWDHKVVHGIVDKFEAEVPSGKVSNLWDNIKNNTDFVLLTLLEKGKISIDAFNGSVRRQYYAPLRGWKLEGDMKDYTDFYGYLETDQAYQKAMIAMQGRSSESDDHVLAYIQSMAETSIIDTNKNQYKALLGKLYEINKNIPGISQVFQKKESIYEVFTKIPDENGNMINTWVETTTKPPQKEFDSGNARTKRGYDITSRKTRPLPLNDYSVSYYVDGQKHIIQLDDPNVASAINNTNNIGGEGIQWAMDLKIPGINWQPVKSWMWLMDAGRRMHTQYNPEFVLMWNQFKDVFGVAPDYWIDGGSPKTFFKNIPLAHKALTYFYYGTNKNHPLYKIAQEYHELGGKITYANLRSIEELSKNIEKEIKSLRIDRDNPTRAQMKHLMKTVSKSWEYIAMLSEVSTRLSIYMSELERGTSKTQAIYSSQKFSGNFLKKGKYSDLAKPFYIFWNAQMQGVYHKIDIARRNPKRFAGMFMGATALGFLMAAIQDFLFDDDDRSGIADFVKYGMIPIPNIFTTKKGDYFKLPLPYFWSWPYSLGASTYDVIKGRMTPEDFATRNTINSMNAFSPIPIAYNDKSNYNPVESFGNALVPYLAKPIVNVRRNKDDFGNQIYKERSRYEKGEFTPQTELGQKNANWVIKKITDGLNTLGGGDEKISAAWKKNPETGMYEHSWINEAMLNHNPSVIEYKIAYLAGGLGKMLSNTSKMVMDAVDPNEDVKLFTIPVAHRWMGTPYAKRGTSEYWDIKNELENTIFVINSAKKVNDTKKLDEIKNDKKLQSQIYAHLVMMKKITDYEDQLKTSEDPALRQALKEAQIEYIKTIKDLRK